MRLGIFGGTFDPIHIGHLILAEQAREQLHLDCVRFIPAGDPWRKSTREVTAARHRVAMVELAVADNPTFEVDESEVRRTGPSYTVETLRLIREGLDLEDELYLLLGKDAVADMPNWHDPAGIATEALIAVAPREGFEPPLSLPFDPARLIKIEMPYIAIGSTELRERCRRGGSLRYLVPSPVDEYIIEHGLYRI